MCDMQLVSLLANDVTKKKNSLRLELLELKRNGRNIPLSLITLTPHEKKDCMEKALIAITCNLPEETKGEYRREISKLLASRKHDRKQIKKTILEGTQKKKFSNLPITNNVHFELMVQEAHERQITELIHTCIIKLDESGDIIELI